MNYKVTYRIGKEIEEVVLRDIEKITYSPEKGSGYRGFWADRMWMQQVAEFQDVLAVVPLEESNG